MSGTENGGKAKGVNGLLWLLLALLGGALAVLCREGFQPNHVMWANDYALGAFKADSSKMTESYTGIWVDHWWIGTEVPANSPNVSTILLTIISPEMFLKVFTPFTMLVLGFSAWLLFRQLKFAPMVCVLGGLAAGLNMHCFSNACWGLGSWNICISMIFLALAALVTSSIRQTWIKAALAGLAVGMSVMEGFDSGAILSVYVAVFIVFLCWTTETSAARKISQSVVLGVLVVFFSVFISASTLSTLVGTQIQGIAGTGQSEQEKRDHWDFATTWSLPKLETLRLVMPGVFGYRLENYDTTPDKAGVYWGKVGQEPHIGLMESSDPKVRAAAAAAMHLPDEAVRVLAGNDAQARARLVDAVARQTGMQRRHTGSGEYAGVLVALLAIFALANSWRRDLSPYSTAERRMIWFWGLAALFSLVAAWGRHAFLYALLYKLPYFSTIRNPVKFLHAFHLLWVTLAGYGLEALYRSYLQSRDDHAESAASPDAAKPGKLSRFEKGWMGGLILAAGAAVVLFWLYGAAHNQLSRNFHQGLAQYIQQQGFSDEAAPRIAAFAIGEMGWFVLFLGLSAGTMACILTGYLRGRRAVWPCLFLSGIMIWDLSRADRPWVRYFDYQEKYAMNPIVDFLRRDPQEHRVAAKLTANDSAYILCPGDFGLLGVACHWWLENDFPYNNIQSVDIDQMSRPPVLETKLFATFAPKFSRDFSQSDFSPPFRFWRLANTRYLLAPAAVVPILNDRGDPFQHGFQIRYLFNLVPKAGVTQPEDAGDLTPVLNNSGPFALIEITNALPRAKLYSNWQTPADDEQATLRLLNSEMFDPAQTVLVANATPVPPAPANPSADPGAVRITRYKPKDVLLQATAKTPAVLLLNDRTARSWNAWIDQKPAQVLRCNYVMRGVFLTPGEHTIEFRFQPPCGPLYVSLAAIAVGILLAAYLLYARFAPPQAAAQAPPAPKAPGGQKPRKT